MKISLPPLSPGVYKVEWKALSIDTHKSSGDFTFQVGEWRVGRSAKQDNRGGVSLSLIC